MFSILITIRPVSYSSEHPADIYMLQVSFSFSDRACFYATSMSEHSAKLFDKWETIGVKCNDQSLERYISIDNHQWVAHSAIKWTARRFKKGTCPIVERLVNTLMMHGRNAGKKLMANRHVQAAFEIVHLSTGKNPIQILIDGVSNAAVREDSCRIGKGG